MSDTIPSGTLLGGKYRVGALLGQGGMGAVYEGMQEGLDRRVALKVLHGHLSNEKELLGRFQREARAVATLGHPNVVQISDFQTNPGEPPFLVMELLQGESLRQLLKRTGPLPPERAAYIFSQVLAALEAAHAKDIVHRDIKPDNIFLSSTSVQDDLVKVLDFGVAKVLRDGDKDGKLTQSGFVVGTLSYMAPEQAMGDEVDGRADLYSVGACMYLALTGRKPFDAPTTPALLKAILTETPVPLAAVRQDVDLSLASLVDRALERDPKKRFANAGEMAAALAPFARATPHEVSASEVPTQPREATAAPATIGRQPVPTAMTAQLGPRAAAPVDPSAAFSQRATAVPEDPPAVTAAAPIAAAAPAPAHAPMGPKGTLVSPARAMPPRPAATGPLFTPPPASLSPELLAAAMAPPPSFTPAPHAMDAPPMVASTTSPRAAGGTAVMPATPAEPAPVPTTSPVPVPVAAPPEPSITQPAAQGWTPPPAVAVPVPGVAPFVAHAPTPAKRGSGTTLLWIGAALIGTLTVIALVAGSLVLRQMMTTEAAAPAAVATSTSTATGSASAIPAADSSTEAEPLPALSARTKPALPPAVATTTAKAKPAAAPTATVPTPTAAAQTAAAALRAASTAIDLSGNQAGLGPAPTTPSATPPPGPGKSTQMKKVK